MTRLNRTFPHGESVTMVRPCCPDCSPYCQADGLIVGQLRGAEEAWWGEPFDGGIDTQAAVFWGDECCPDCGVCPVCQGWV